MAGAEDGTAQADDEVLAAELGRLADRLRSLSDTRLALPLPPYASRADAARGVAQRLGEATQGVEERDAEAEPGWRTVPRLHDLAVGDQVAVTGTDLRVAAAGLDPDTRVWVRGARVPLGVVVVEAVEAVRALRLSL